MATIKITVRSKTETTVENRKSDVAGAIHLLR